MQNEGYKASIVPFFCLSLRCMWIIKPNLKAFFESFFRHAGRFSCKIYSVASFSAASVEEALSLSLQMEAHIF